jgi:hypothetical protein
MKKLTTVFIIVITSTILNAQDTTTLVQPPILSPLPPQEISREQIQMRDLPKPVNDALRATDYAGWAVEAVYKSFVTDPEEPDSEGLLIYIIELKRKNEKAYIKFDKDGKRLDDNDYR